MSTNPRKRPAPSSPTLPPPKKTSQSPANSAPSNANLEAQLSLFTRSRIQDLLLKLAKQYPVVAAEMKKEVAIIRKVMAQAPAINFQVHSSSVWHLLNTKYKNLRPSQQYGVVGDVMRGISDAVKDGILSKVHRDVCYGTKYNALSVLRKIAKSILLTEPGEIAKGVQNNGSLDIVSSAMKDIIAMMEVDERKRVFWGEENLVEKLEELDDMRDCYMEGLPEILEMFGVGKEEEDNGEDEDGQSGSRDAANNDSFAAPAPPPIAAGRAASRRMEVIDLT